ncbi:uncharacterized protein LOC113503586 isoform X2 [Trichoplusia ni]|uniref:Uncharacterized protein LOC113503586 isoform X2 n=1 Tax=Trichoplusia ni TaxID=7111 RepID=A0A7E5WM63_TRINI|nr:uncharacterized protein LOC113503586 isoform X2 [Trichoplusia ni]
MQCNQSFCGLGFPNAPIFNYNSPLQCNTNLYSDVVGEGVVTSLTLPDGRVQLFFKPTLKWWTPNTFQPNIPMQTNMNVNVPFYNNPLGTWFVRSINNPVPPNLFTPSSQQFDGGKLYNSESNLNGGGNGYQLKFHQDHSTSTTDIHYFYPCLRQLDYTFRSCRGTAAVQVETQPVENNMTCHYEVRCAKTCNCDCNCNKPMSLVSIAEPKNRKGKSYPDTPPSSCEDTRKKRNKRNKKRKNKTKKVVCACESTDDIQTMDKSITTYKDIGSCCAPANGRETQTYRGSTPSRQCCSRKIPMFLSDSLMQRCNVKQKKSWHLTPATPVSEGEVRSDSVEKLLDFGDTGDDDSSSIFSCDS